MSRKGIEKNPATRLVEAVLRVGGGFATALSQQPSADSNSN